MKRDLLIAGVLVVLAGLGVGVVAILPALQKDDAPKTAKPKPEPIALIKKDPPAPPVKQIKDVRSDTKPPIEAKKQEATPKKVDAETTPAKKQEAPPPKKIDPPKVIAKVEPKNEEKKPAAVKIIALGDDLIKINDPDGEYTVEKMVKGAELKLLGRVKTLKIVGVNERSTLDAKDLQADEIIFLGNINSSKVILGQEARLLKVRDLNNSAELDASALDVREIIVAGNVNSQSTLKLRSAKGSVEIIGEINDRSTIAIDAPDGKVLFKNGINSNAKLAITARDMEFVSAINGPQTQLDLTLTRGGSLTLKRVNGGVQIHYRKADPGDPEPRVDAKDVDARAQLRVTTKK